LRVGLFFGSFNPIHNGHLIIANHIVQYGSVDEVWFVVSPQNPFKKKASLLPERDRLHLVNLAIEDDENFKVSDIEFSLPKPSYTAHTLVYFRDKFPDTSFSIIIGEDNLNHLHKWKNADSIIQHHPIIYYPRLNSTESDRNEVFLKEATIEKCTAPIITISSSYVRQMIKEGKQPKYVMPSKPYLYVEEMNFYKD